MDTNAYGTGSVKIRKTHHQKSVRRYTNIFLQCTSHRRNQGGRKVWWMSILVRFLRQSNHYLPHRCRTNSLSASLPLTLNPEPSAVGCYLEADRRPRFELATFCVASERSTVKAAFHDTDADILADIVARIVARKSRVSDVRMWACRASRCRCRCRRCGMRALRR